MDAAVRVGRGAVHDPNLASAVQRGRDSGGVVPVRRRLLPAARLERHSRLPRPAVPDRIRGVGMGLAVLAEWMFGYGASAYWGTHLVSSGDGTLWLLEVILLAIIPIPMVLAGVETKGRKLDFQEDESAVAAPADPLAHSKSAWRPSRNRPEAVTRRAGKHREEAAMRTPDPAEIGRVGDLGPADVLAALGAASAGRVYDLDAGRFVGMPQWDGHPTFTLTPYRTPHGIRLGRDVELFAPGRNAAGISMVTELMVTGMHTGTHLDALCHITDGDDTWYGGYSAADHCGDFGPVRADAATIPPIITRGVFGDAAGYLGQPFLPRGDGLGRDVLAASRTRREPTSRAKPACSFAPVSCPSGRTGSVTRHRRRRPGPGRASRLIDDKECVVLGSDTSTVEQIPSADPDNPHPSPPSPL